MARPVVWHRWDRDRLCPCPGGLADARGRCVRDAPPDHPHGHGYRLRLYEEVVGTQYRYTVYCCCCATADGEATTPLPDAAQLRQRLAAVLQRQDADDP